MFAASLKPVPAPAAKGSAAAKARQASAPPTLDSSWVEHAGSPGLGVQAASGLVVDLDRRSILWQREPQASRAPASLAKMVTAMVAADLAPLDRELTVPAEATQVEPDSTVMGLAPGDRVTVRELMYGLFLESGNDAAETLARSLTDRRHFVELMNRKAAALGMRSSRFTNPSGLDEPGMRTTAYDLALAAVAIAKRYPDLVAVAGTAHAVLPRTAGHRQFDLYTLNRLVSTYPGATGLKTGYTDEAGFCLAGTATRGGRQLAVVVLGDGWSLTSDAAKLLDYGFSH